MLVNKQSLLKVTQVVILVALSVLLMTGYALAENTAQQKVVVLGGSVNTRTGPAMNHDKSFTVTKGQELTVLGRSPGWLKTEIDGKTGWIAGWLVKPKSGTAIPGNDELLSGTVLLVKESVVNVRSGPGTNYSVVTKVNAGNQFTVAQKSGDWYKVNITDQKQGWIAGWVAEVRTITTPSRGDSDPVIPATSDKLDDVSYTVDNGSEELIIRSQGVLKYKVFRMNNPARIIVDLENSSVNDIKDFVPNGVFVSNVRVAQFSLTPMTVRVVLDLNRPVSFKTTLSDDKQTLRMALSEPSIQGKVVVIDAGHGGYDPGAVGVTGLEEKAFNYETALMLREKLTALGATVVLTREDDSFISLTGRCAVANNIYADVFVSIHANASENRSVNGTSTYFYAPSSNPSLYAQYEQRRNLAQSVQDKMIEALGTRNIGILQENFAVLRGTNMPSILVEAAFLSNAGEEALLKDSGFRNKVAQAVADGLVEYFATN